jgi:hypothetical protein
MPKKLDFGFFIIDLFKKEQKQGAGLQNPMLRIERSPVGIVNRSSLRQVVTT